MKKYGVTLPIDGCVYVEEFASNEEDAIEKALNDDKGISKALSENSNFGVTEKLVQGNVFYGQCSKAYAEEIK